MAMPVLALFRNHIEIDLISIAVCARSQQADMLVLHLLPSAAM